MKEDSIKEDILNLNIEKYIELVIEKNYCDCNELNVICSGSQCDGSRNVAYSMNHILSDYKRVLKENEELKKFHIQDNKHLDFIMEHSITVQKVKDKIEEILNNGEYRIIFEGDAEFPDEATCIDAQKYIKLEKLQELLEGRK